MSHVKINGENYRLDESGEGQHYIQTKQPLRPPNAQLVQGESGVFQLRPDLLLWSWTDWSSGENQIKLDSSDTGRAYILQNVNPFRRRGEVAAGYAPALAQDSTGASDFAVPGTLVKAYGSLFMVGSAVDDVFEWDGAKFGAAEDITSATAASDPNSAIGDQQYLFVHETGTTKIHRRTSGGTWSNHNDQCALTGEIMMVELGAYVYIWEPLSGKVYEISKATANTATAETEIHNVPISSAVNADQYLMVAGDNRIYLAVSINGETFVHEIIPTSAAGTGFGTELSRIPGITAEAVFYSGGTLFLVGYDKLPDGTVGADRQIFYIDPEGTYGTLGSLRGFTKTNGPSTIYPVPAGGRLALSALALPGTWEDDDADAVRMSLFEIDQVSGGIAMTGSHGGELSSTEQATSLVYFEGKYFTSLTTKCMYWDHSAVEDTIDGIAVSPSNDFGVAEQKILEKIEVVCDPLPAGSAIHLGYSLDDAGWSNSTIVSATNAVGGTYTVSTSSATQTFRSMRVRVLLDGASGSAPVVKAINTFVRVNKHLRVWDLILDLADDMAHGYNGAKLLANLTGLAENTVFEFVDNYVNHDHTDGPDTIAVVLDSLSLNLSQEGEGQAQIRLIEVLDAASVPQ